jgi:hypothetical protein
LVTAKELEAFPPGDFGFELVEGRSVPQRRARRGGHRRPSEAVTVYRQSGAPITLRQDQKRLDLNDVVPGFGCLLQEIFD